MRLSHIFERSARAAWLSAAFALSAAALPAAEVTAVVSPRDGCELIENPGCGYAAGSWGRPLAPDGSEGEVELCKNSANCTKLWSLQKFSKGYVYKDYDYYTNHIEHFVGGADIPLTPNALLAISNSLASCRRNGGTCIPRFAYTWDGWGGAEPDDFEMLLTHIRQIGAVVSQFRDVVPAVECGMIGAYGEMHTSRYTAAEYQNRVVGAWLDSLPGDMALLVRSPSVWMNFLGIRTSAFFGGGMAAMDDALRSRMGFYNDGYLGTDYDYGTWGGGGGSTTWSRGEGREFLRGQAVPYGGEFAGVTSEYFDTNVHLLDTSRFNLVAEWYDTHLSYLRTIRSTSMTVTQKLAATPFSASRWAFAGMPRLDEYEGVDLRKFCEDHMGYRFVARGADFAGAPNAAVLSVALENTGFGQLLFDDALEILLSNADGTGEEYSIPVPGVSLRGIRGGETAELELPFAYPAGISPGNWDVSLRVRVPLADEDGSRVPRRAVRFANENAYNRQSKANFICSVRLEDGFDIAPDDIWFAHSAASGKSFGGTWGAEVAFDDLRKRVFAIDAPKPRGALGIVEFDLAVQLLSDIPEPDGGAASFVFLSEGGRPVPYAFTADGWLRLGGVNVRENGRVRLEILLFPGSVEYWLDGVALTDGKGRSRFPAARPLRQDPSLVFIGTETDKVGFTATIEDLPPAPFILYIR